MITSDSEPTVHQKNEESCSGESQPVVQPRKLILQKRKQDNTFVEPLPKVRKTIMDYYSAVDDIEEEEYEEPNSPQLNIPMVPQNNYFTTTQVHAPKKLSIKGFKRKEVDRDTKLQENWPILKESIEAIQSKQKISWTLEALYRIIENLCEAKLNLGGELYDRLQNLLRTHVGNLQRTLIENCEKDGDIFLNKLDSIWTDYCHQATMIRNVFLYLDRTYILQNNNVPSLWETALNVFREEIMDKSSINKRLVSQLLRVIDEERNGKHINRDLVKNLLRMLTSLQIYTQVFEREFISASGDLFSREGDVNARDLESSAYFKYVAKLLADEGNRVDYYLDETTRKPLLSLIENTLITRHMQNVLNKGLDAILDENRLEDLALIFTLVSRVKDGQVMLKAGFSNYIKRVGKSVVMDAERDKNMVENLMTMKNKLDHIVFECFRNEEKFQQAEKDAFDYFVNTRPNKPAELIAKYMDGKLRSGNKETSDEELDKLMDRVITLFRFIQGKDVFEAFYKKDLAKRLLLGRSASVDAEKAMLCKLKQECGAGFTHKLEGMFKDMELSLDLAFDFRRHVEHEVEQGKCQPIMEFGVNILTLGQWPAYEPVELTLPAGMCRSLQMFQDFYTTKHQGRKLQWQHSLGQCVLKAIFRKGCTKELLVSLYQGVVLLLFNGCREFTFSEIQGATKIEEKELKRTMFSLCLGKNRILLRDSKNKDICEDDKFTVNTALQEKLYRIKISQVQMKETEEEHKQTEEQVNQDRQYQIDAAAVRIMKARKNLTHQQLITELFAQLRFPVKAVDLKKRISSLIERDYIARDAEDHNVYKYVA